MTAVTSEEAETVVVTGDEATGSGARLKRQST